jgi:hypothetical protein
VVPRAGLDEVEKRKFLALLELELRPLGRPAHSQSPYRLSYAAPDRKCTVLKFLAVTDLQRDVILVKTFLTQFNTTKYWQREISFSVWSRN